MPLFNPPLPKPGIKRCPSCGSPIKSPFANGPLSTWVCNHCGAELGLDVHRCIPGWLLGIALCYIGMSSSVDEWPGLPKWAFLPLFSSGILLSVFAGWWFAYVRVHQKVSLMRTEWRNQPPYKPGNKHCPDCGSPVAWTSLWWRLSWQGHCASFCGNCGAALTLDVGRYLMGWIPPAAFFAVWLWILSHDTSSSGWLGAPVACGGILLCVFAQRWFASVRLDEEVTLGQTGWRNLPLYKPGNKRCPNCGNPVSHNSKRPIWARWHCSQCGAGLRHDTGRLVLALFLFVAYVGGFLAALLSAILRNDYAFPDWCALLALPAPFLVTVFVNWWCVSVKLDEKAALKPGSP